jgi:hypothetical protein
MRTFQHHWALGAINVTNSRLMPMQSMELEVEGEDDDLFMVLCHCHRSMLRDMNFLSTVDSLFMNINEDDIIPRRMSSTEIEHKIFLVIHGPTQTPTSI